MQAHQLWHLVVLGVTLLAAAALAILVLAPLVFDGTPPDLARRRPLLLGLIALAALLLAAEWLFAH
ncbi:MAG: hypothetical protein GEU78_06870 [Actinobacteria bacterium]|jgi:hypothetical protein|nr:hypothetical protein [Actinomycetota bacterium]